MRWLKVLDQDKCIGCHACTTACKSENEVPVGVTRTYVKSVDVGVFPQARRAFQVTRCNQCADAPCVSACPTQAMFRREDGIVDFDKSICIGCKACMAACPYDAIFINPEDHSAEKCNMCAHRLEVGLEPACVTVCPTGAILVGDGNDPASPVAASWRVSRCRCAARRRRPGPACTTRAPTRPRWTRWPPAARTAGCSPGPPRAHRTRSWSSPVTRPAASSAAALLSYDVPHHAPWGWRVSLYTWTKSIAAGAFGVPVLLAFLGYLGWGSSAVRWAAPAVALAFLAVTGVLLIADLKHPLRFYLIFTRHHWRSWLVRGSFIIGGYGGVARAVPPGRRGGQTGARQVLAGVGIPLALATAVYTAYLFAQAKARDLWQSPLLPAHLAVQAVLAGAAAMLPVLAWLSPGRAVTAAEVTLAVAAAAHVLLVAGETTLPHVTAHAHLATTEMVRGRFAWFFWPGLVLVAAAVAAPWTGVAAAPLALAGLLAHEHAYVQAGQSVPLA